ncbi:MAG: hypothetical protein ACO4CI_11310 [Phycisphaerales bacterium]
MNNNTMTNDNQFEMGLAHVACEEVFVEDDLGVEDDRPTCDDVAEPVYDGPADDSHMYPDDVEQDEYPW